MVYSVICTISYTICFSLSQYIMHSLSRFNKREEDFPSLKEYNDYLEEVEDMSKFFSLGVSYIFDEKS